jgi:RNA polymerase sigma factor (sigma-70 family)
MECVTGLPEATILQSRPSKWPVAGKLRLILNDSDFLDELRQRDPAAVRHLTDCYVPSVWRYVFIQVGGDHHLAEDLVSEAVLALVRAAASGAEVQSPGAWLRSVASNKVQDHFRAAARVQHLLDQVKQTEPAADTNDAPAQQQRLERRIQVREVMDELPERHRLVLEWKYLDKLAVREIAARLDLTEKAAESILFRARREFREKLSHKEKKEDHPPPDPAPCPRREAQAPASSLQPTTQERS